VARRLPLRPDMSPSNIEKVLQVFFRDHAGETFCAMAIDAGFLYLNTDEGFEKRRQRYSAEWEVATKPVTLAEAKACAKDDLSDNYPSLAYRLRTGESFERALEVENKSRAKRRAEGNPYETRGSDSWQSLRYGTGNFEYGELVNLNLDDAYQEHHEENQPVDSAYAKKVSVIIAGLNEQKAQLLEGVKVSKDFRIYAVDHPL
jgi:hypothetical protein